MFIKRQIDTMFEKSGTFLKFKKGSLNKTTFLKLRNLPLKKHLN